jgi:hypothetical protein
MFSHYSSFIPLVLVLFVWGTFVTLCVTVTNIYYYYSIRASFMFNSSYITTEKLPIQSVPINTNVVSLNPAYGEMYSIQHYVIKFFSDLWFSLGTPVSSTNKIDVTI